MSKEITINASEAAVLSILAIKEKADSDKTFAAKLTSCAGTAEIYAFAKELITVSEEEFTAAIDEFEGLELADGAELSDTELAGVAGGYGTIYGVFFKLQRVFNKIGDFVFRTDWADSLRKKGYLKK